MKAYIKPHPHTKNKFMQNVGGRKKYLASTYPEKKNTRGIKGLKKKFMQSVGGRKKHLASTYPEKKNSRGIKGLKKKFMPIPNHPTPHSLQKLNGWPLN